MLIVGVAQIFALRKWGDYIGSPAVKPSCAAPVVQLDRASAFEAESCRFESYRVRQIQLNFFPDLRTN